MDQDALRSGGNPRTRDDERVAHPLARDAPSQAIDDNDRRLRRCPCHTIGDGSEGIGAGATFLVRCDEGLANVDGELSRREAREADASTIAACLQTQGGKRSEKRPQERQFHIEIRVAT